MGRAELLFARPICASVGGMTQTLDARLNTYSSAVLSIFRIVFGFLFTFHGTMKLFGWPLGTSVPAGTWPLWWAGLIEFVTGLLIVVGLFTRIAAFIASGHMAVAYFWRHLPDGFWPYARDLGGNGGELVVMFCFAFLLLVFLGPGALALDTRRRGAVGVSRTSRWRR
jgi:putative oxidoreductase